MFDIQLFGANDTVTSAVDLKINSNFSDGDTRIFTVKNPRLDLQESAITSLQEYILTNQILVGDKTGAAFVDFEDAVIVEKTITRLDLS